MKTELEAEVREAFAARAGRLPVDAAARLRSIDYGPREHRLRAPAIGAGALAGAATVGTALAVVLGGSTPAYAGWSASPTTAAAPSPAADASCQSQLSGTYPGATGASLGSGAWQNVLTDVRGPFTVALFQDDGAYAACFTSPSFTQVNQVTAGGGAGAQGNSVGVHRLSGGGSSPASGVSGTVAGGTSSGDLQQVMQTHLSISGEGPYTLVEGRTASGVTGVTLVRDDGQDVVATVEDGWLVAWWPGSATATSAQVTLPVGHDERGSVVVWRPDPVPATFSAGIVHLEWERRHVLLGVLGWPGGGAATPRAGTLATAATAARPGTAEADQAITSMRRPVASSSPPSWTWACVDVTARRPRPDQCVQYVVGRRARRRPPDERFEVAEDGVERSAAFAPARRRPLVGAHRRTGRGRRS